jgi:hypothetical protein
MKAPILTFLVCLFAITGRAQQNYDASLIPKELMSYASAVVRYSDEGIEVKDLDNTIYHIKEAITVLNKNALFTTRSASLPGSLVKRILRMPTQPAMLRCLKIRG